MELRDFILLLLKKRSSCRYFDKQYVIPKKNLETLIRASDYGPSAGNLRAYSIYHEENHKKKKEIQKAILDQGFISDASTVFCICAAPVKSTEKYGERGKLYAVQDATISGMCITVAATAIDLDSCWVGSINEKEIRKIYGIPEQEIPLSLVCVGRAQRF
mgnify:CR=1 FL=1